MVGTLHALRRRLSGRRTRNGLLIGMFCALWMSVGGVWLYQVAPIRTVAAFLTAAYPGTRTPSDVQLAVTDRGLNDTMVNVVARFATDPDYGSASPLPAGTPYTTEVKLVRQGWAWVADEGIVVDGRAFGIFSGGWRVTDPALEAARRASEPCG